MLRIPIRCLCDPWILDPGWVEICIRIISVAEPRCLSRILIFYPSRIPDLGSRIQKPQQKRVVNKNFLLYLFWRHKLHKIENNFIIEMPKKKFWPSFQRMIDFLPKNLSLSSKNYGFGIRDPRFRINLFRIPDPGPGVKKAPDPGSGFTTLRIIFPRA